MIVSFYDRFIIQNFERFFTFQNDDTFKMTLKVRMLNFHFLLLLIIYDFKTSKA